MKSEIVVRDGRVYHLGLNRQELSTKIMMVGDPARTDIVASFFDQVESRVAHREYVTITGNYQGERISVMGTGMSTDNIEVALAEIYTLVAFNLETKKKESHTPPVTIIRVGTSGGVQEDIPAGTTAISQYALGFDSTGLYFEDGLVPPVFVEIEEQAQTILNRNIPDGYRFKGRLPVYASAASDEVFRRLIMQAEKLEIDYVTGITATTPGFYGPSARKMEGITNTVEDIKKHLGTFALRDLRIVNMEMESSLLFHLGTILGFECGTICPIISGPSSSDKPIDYSKAVNNAIEVALQVLCSSQ